jgi:hypothetical protein
MPLDNNYTQKQNGLAAQATAALHRRDMSQPHGTECADTSRNGNTGGTLRHHTDFIKESRDKARLSETPLPQTTPPCGSSRKSRAKKTTPEMEKFLDGFFFDWLSLTAPNSEDGKGKRIMGEEGQPDAQERFEQGERENSEAASRLFLWATLYGFRVIRIGKGTDGYNGGAHFGFTPVDKDRIVTIRDGHSVNMPNIEITGADGYCSEIALDALAQLGPMLASRIDSARDLSQAGLWDASFEMACKLALQSGMEQPRVMGTEGGGRSYKMGKGEASVTVYEKDFERFADGKIAKEDIDENLVRFEFRFRPVKERKSGLAKIAAEGGAGALISTTKWVRTFVEKLAVLTDYATESDAKIGVGRVTGTPDVKRPTESAKAIIKQYRRSLCNGAIAQIVNNDFDGDWGAAKVDPDAVIDAVCSMVRDGVSGVVDDLCERHGLMVVHSVEAEADRQQELLDVWMIEQNKRTRMAQIKLGERADRMRERCGLEREAA